MKNRDIFWALIGFDVAAIIFAKNFFGVGLAVIAIMVAALGIKKLKQLGIYDK
jgi:hypothetical protein